MRGGAGTHGAERGAANVGDIRLHHLLVAELVAHGLVGLLVVGVAVVARRLVEVADRRPAPRAGREVAAVRAGADLGFGEQHVAERHGSVAGVLLRDSIPGRGLLASSASARVEHPVSCGQGGGQSAAPAPPRLRLESRAQASGRFAESRRDGHRWGSAPALRGNPTHESRAAGVDLPLDPVVEVVGGQRLRPLRLHLLRGACEQPAESSERAMGR